MTHKQNGSFILILASISAVSSMALITIMLSVQSLSKNINLSTLQFTSQQLVDLYQQQVTEEFANGINLNLLPVEHNSKHVINNIQHNITSQVKFIEHINWPLNGFSLNSVYTTTFIEIISIASTAHTKSRTSAIGLACIQINNGSLNKRPEPSYSIAPGQDSNTLINYELIPETGQLWRNTAKKTLLLDLGFKLGRQFSRAEFILHKIEHQTRLAIVFIELHKPEVASAHQNNNLFIIFDDILLNSPASKTLSFKDLTEFNNNSVLKVSDNGYRVKLTPGHLLSSAITILDGQIIFITQTTNHKSDKPDVYKNTLHQISLLKERTQRSLSRPLADSTKLLHLKINAQNQTEYSIGTQFDSALIKKHSICKKQYQYEK